MALAQGTLDEQRAALEAVAAALQDGRLSAAAAQASAARLDRLAERYPLQPRPYAPGEREADAALLATLWTRAFTALRGATPPQGPLRVIAQANVAGTGVSEAGLDEAGVRSLFPAGADIEWLWVPSLATLQPADIPQDGRCNVLVSTPRRRHPPQAAQWPLQLQLLLWNPFQALDCPAPALISWGYHPTALVGLRDWLAGRGQAQGRAPVQALAALG
jgi:beta-N-acetylhexosaminidase